MPKAVNITGQRFGHLIAIKPVKKYANRGDIPWLCRCDCGNQSVVYAYILRSGKTRSCGCTGKQWKHGYCSRKYVHPIYNAWNAMRDRCNNPNYPNYHRYGGRGIKICKRWDNFANFFADLNPRPQGHSLERIDNNGDCKPSNVRWATPKEQANNRHVNPNRKTTIDRFTTAEIEAELRRRRSRKP